MLAKKQLPTEYQEWNARWGAPFGHQSFSWLPRRVRNRWPCPSLVGIFGLQGNNTTREYEYPWCYHATPLGRGMRVLEIGGSLAGFQFLLSRLGMEVVNLDPGEKARGKGWPITSDTFERLNSTFGTNVKLQNCFIEEAQFEDESFDRVFAISVFEHIPQGDLASLMRHIRRVLKPGGLLVATADLFLDVQPFAPPDANVFGTNIDIRALLERNGFRLTHGEPSELLGFDGFSAARVRSGIEAGDLMVGERYPALAQCFVAAKC